ncbi:hypothetical protein R3W88_023214 [Solanum pinnatisectum]|uniref:Vegetative cell wall protein gp1-like n=1 Tax=Solanum pinnatisectum TaxID=50273 RepID=A0AAV9LWU2_9SOLN|nr:hypothetical protein R3W88_023214 [Solanum pinnatisectum]
MASQQPPRPLFRFASMVRPAAQPAQPPPASAPPAPSSQQMFRPTTPFRPASPTVTAPQPPQPPVPTAPPVAVVTAPPQPQVSAPGSPISPRRRQPVATSPPRSPVAPPQSVVSPPKAPSPRSPVAAQPQRAATDVPKSPVIRASPVTRSTTSVPQSPFKPLASNVTTESAPTSTPYSSFPPSPKTKLPDSIQTLINQSSPSKVPPPSQNVFQPNLVKSQTYSPQTKPAVSHPPSPLKLPPSQLELESKIPSQVDQKSVVVHETTRANTNGHHVLQTARNGNTMENGKQELVKKDKGVHQKKKVSNSDGADDFGMSVLTLAGENKGAVMELSPSRKTYSPQSLQKKGSPKSWNSEDDGEKSGNESGRKGDKMQNKSLPMTAFMNSNVQGINNSILHNASCTHHDPGVHLVFSRKTNGSNGLHIKGSQKS